jgi:hypothetical protein
MIKLYGGASPLFVHHVGDAIELWLAERARPELASVIHALVSGITDEQATQLFKTQDNPTPKAQRPRR